MVTTPVTQVSVDTGVANGGTAVFSGLYSDFPLPAGGSNGSLLASFYRYGVCPAVDSTTEVTAASGVAAASGELPLVAVSVLPLGVELCMQACVVSAELGELCGDEVRFLIPTVRFVSVLWGKGRV